MAIVLVSAHTHLTNWCEWLFLFNWPLTSMRKNLSAGWLLYSCQHTLISRTDVNENFLKIESALMLHVIRRHSAWWPLNCPWTHCCTNTQPHVLAHTHLVRHCAHSPYELMWVPIGFCAYSFVQMVFVYIFELLCILLLYFSFFYKNLSSNFFCVYSFTKSSSQHTLISRTDVIGKFLSHELMFVSRSWLVRQHNFNSTISVVFISHTHLTNWCECLWVCTALALVAAHTHLTNWSCSVLI